MAPLLACLMLGATFQSPCVACEKDTEEYESAKKRQRVKPSSCFESPSLAINQWNTLPEEVWLDIFDQLSFSNLSNVQKVCRHWHTLGRDDTLSLTQQILRKPLAEVLWKLEAIKNGSERLKQSITTLILNPITCQRFFSSPDAFYKLLRAPTVIELILRTPSLFPLLFGSQLTASEIYQALPQHALDEDQQTKLDAYAKAMPVFPFQQKKLSEEFVHYAKTYSSHYKAFYLLSLFNIPAGKPMKALLKRINKEVISEEIYENTSEDQAIFIPQGMAYFTDLPSDIAYNIGEYCDKWAERNSNDSTKSVWLEFVEIFYRKSVSQGHEAALYNLGMHLERQGKLDEAETFYRQAAHQGFADAQCNLGVMLEEQGKLNEAETFYRQAASQGFADAQYNLGLLLNEQGKLDEAETFYRQAASQGLAEAQCKLGDMLVKQGKLDEAETFYRQAASQGYVRAQYNLGVMLVMQSKLDEAETFYRQAANQGYAWAQCNLGMHLERQGKLDEAKTFYLQSASQGYAYAQCKLGVLLEEQGKLDEAETFYRQAANQGFADAQYNLGLLLEEQGKLDEAETFYRQAVNQGLAEAQCKLGFCLEKKGNFEEAIINYEKAVKQGDEFSCLSIAYLLKTQPKLFQISSEELNHRITQLREQGKDSLENWSKERSLDEIQFGKMPAQKTNPQ
ncbi:MAG: F-box/SEL1-like repeat protein [Alphaproteobacteria bacterium]|nr:F-box/SEL1-like repeat protein [Alphaproteobacteria bacterium]